MRGLLKSVWIGVVACAAPCEVSPTKGASGGSDAREGLALPVAGRYRFVNERIRVAPCHVGVHGLLFFGLQRRYKFDASRLFLPGVFVQLIHVKLHGITIKSFL